MHAADFLTLLASLVALLSVVLAHVASRKQLQNTAALAVKQIEAASRETSRKLRAEVLLKEKQIWIREFRETINEILYLGDPDLDGRSTQRPEERIGSLVRLAHKVDLLLPIGQAHADLISAIVVFIQFLKDGASPDMKKDRLNCEAEITVLTRRILGEELRKVESDL